MRGNADWQNASAFLAAHLHDALMVDAWGPSQGATHGKPYNTWQRGVVLDPSVPSYHSFLLEQLQRKLDRLPHFQGIVIDRSDWMGVYDLNADDGVSWVQGAPARSMKAAFMNITAALRQRLVTSGRADAVMLLNTLGCLRFSEPGRVASASCGRATPPWLLAPPGTQCSARWSPSTAPSAKEAQ